MSLKNENKSETTNYYINLTLAYIALISFMAVLFTRAVSFQYSGVSAGLAGPTDGDYFIWANTMHVCFGVLIVSIVALFAQQKLSYFPIIGAARKKSLDERQKTTRNSVFERSYFLIVLAVLLCILFVNDWNNFILIKDGDWALNGDRIYPFQATVLMLIGLPSIVASGRKDS